MDNLFPAAIDDGKPDEGLPEGWTVRVNIRKDGRKDRRYTEPVHGYTFRSMKEVLRYVETGSLGSRSAKLKGSRHDKDAEDDLLAPARKLDFGTMNGNDEFFNVSSMASPITTILPGSHTGEGIGPSSKAADPEVEVLSDSVPNGFNNKSKKKKTGYQLTRRASKRKAGPPRKFQSTPNNSTLPKSTPRLSNRPKRKQQQAMPAEVIEGQLGSNKRKKANDVDKDDDDDVMAPSVKQCLDMVESLPGVDSDPEFDFTIVASRLFVKKIYRVMFVSLREDKRLKWLREYARAGVTAD
ncbi:Methyl-CpG-binding domain-containing protein 13 [Linum perenne]